MTDTDRTIKVKLSVDTTQFDTEVARIKRVIADLHACGVSAEDIGDAVRSVRVLTTQP